MKDVAKLLLEHGSLEAYVKTFVDESAFEYMIGVLKDGCHDDVKEALLDEEEDLDDYSPLYDDWDELFTSEKENLINDGTELLIQHLPFHHEIKQSEEIYDAVYKEVENFVNLLGSDIFYE